MTKFDVEVECNTCAWGVWFRGVENMEQAQAWYEKHIDEFHPEWTTVIPDSDGG